METKRSSFRSKRGMDKFQKVDSEISLTVTQNFNFICILKKCTKQKHSFWFVMYKVKQKDKREENGKGRKRRRVY